MANHADVVVIGGGIMGTATAFWLTQMGVRNVVLLEKRTLACGATGKTGGFVRMHYANQWDGALAYEGWKVYSNWADVVGGDCSFVRTGFLMIVGPDNVENLKQNVAMLKRIGVPTSVLTPEEVRDLQPAISIEGIGAAAYEPESGYADGSSAATGFARRAVQSGARVRQGVEVRSVAVQGGRVVGVETSEGPIATSVVVNATGGWAPTFTRSLGIALPVRTRREIAVFVRRPPELRHQVVIDVAAETAFRQEGQNLTYVAGRSSEWDVNPDDYDEQVSMEIVTEAVGRFVKRMPRLADTEFVRGLAGMDGYTDDRHLVLGRAPGVDGLYLAVGGSGTGFKVAPGIGKCMAELIVHGESRSVDICPFRIERFAENDPIVGPYEYGWMDGLGAKLV